MPPTAGKLNLINLSKDGTFRASGEHQTLPLDVDAIFDHLSETEVEHLVLYFHGGLTSEMSGVSVANRLMPLLQDKVGAHPVFFVWESGWQEIIKNNLSSVADLPLFKELLKVLLKFALSKLQSLAEGRAPDDRLVLATNAEVAARREQELVGPVEIDEQWRVALTELSEDQQRQFENYLENDLEFQAAADALAAAMEVEAGRAAVGEAEPPEDLAWLSPDFVQEMEVEVQADGGGRGLVTTAFLVKSAMGILTRVVQRLIERTDHGLVCTATEELLRQFYLDKVGGWLWGQMKQEIQDAFADNAGLSGELLHGGTYFLSRLAAYLQDPQHKSLKISLIGHSAGSIYICRLLENALTALPGDFKFHHIAFLAPGVDFELFRRALVDHADRITDFMLYTMSDDLEARDAIVPVVYPRSLLYFVSGLLEDSPERPIVGMERFFSGKAPYIGGEFDPVRDFIKVNAPQRVVWSPTVGAAPGFNCTAKAHGGFAFDVTTQDSLAAYLSN